MLDVLMGHGHGKMKVKLKVMLIITQVFDSMGELDGDGDSECCLPRQEWDNDEDDDCQGAISCATAGCR